MIYKKFYYNNKMSEYSSTSEAGLESTYSPELNEILKRSKRLGQRSFIYTLGGEKGQEQEGQGQEQEKDQQEGQPKT